MLYKTKGKIISHQRYTLYTLKMELIFDSACRITLILGTDFKLENGTYCNTKVVAVVWQIRGCIYLETIPVF